MTPTEPITHIGTSPPIARTLRRVRFVLQADAGQETLVNFTDPTPHAAVCLTLETSESTQEPTGGIDILTVPVLPTDHPGLSEELFKWVAEPAQPEAAPPIAITIHGAQIIWGASRAAILAAEDRTPSFLLAVIDFCYYERELQKLEGEIRENWPSLERDTPLAYMVTESDPDRFEEVGQRMEQTLKRRVRLARLIPHLYQPRAYLPPLANQLVDRLRERAHVEARHEALSSQLEAFEHVYEMNSQRISDFTTAQQGRTLEWIIIVLLAAEALLLLIDLVWLMGI
jgi:hypothetical protein